MYNIKLKKNKIINNKKQIKNIKMDKTIEGLIYILSFCGIVLFIGYISYLLYNKLQYCCKNENTEYIEIIDNEIDV